MRMRARHLLPCVCRNCAKTNKLILADRDRKSGNKIIISEKIEYQYLQKKKNVVSVYSVSVCRREVTIFPTSIDQFSAPCLRQLQEMAKSPMGLSKHGAL